MDVKMFAVPLVLLGVHQSGIDLNEENNKQTLRIVFGVVQVVVMCVHVIMWLFVQIRNDTTNLVEVEEKQLTGEKAGEEVKTSYTFKAYDQKQILGKMGQALMGIAITSGIHYKWGITQPLLMQSVLQPLSFASDPLFKIHLMGADDSKAPLKRPFKVEKPSLFPDMSALDPAKAEEKDEGQERKKRGAANKSSIKRRTS
mmetsp:Transcript_39876/g.55415  ORF Transcript_39876/g.55415 Transcript_39876/m.55415 type:complete len:200 (-) Transcript_39876:222-821(-)|eukprot:CAMPEP_0196583990 /NCGR_PEP_ID=MMETSP1081-20130531/45402_1 /TAXON_ID=36882 /ORGANISM="Pyramimonas amylifera, Strain CCMP720" /LENGTH=199 /DNA_ID=CAMNT_0041905045 /DNA_START=70 /DNA_END=669 /DNA_ORIENTATION=-